MLDVTGALNNNSHKRLHYNHRKLFIDLKIMDLISSFISIHSIMIKTNEYVSDNIQIDTRISTMSLLSHILYLHCNLDLIETLFNINEKFTTIRFVDDVFLFATTAMISKTAYC